MGVLGHFLYRPSFGAKGETEYSAFDEGLVAADAEIYAAQLHKLATSNVHGLVFTGPGAGGGLDADKLDGKHASEFLISETDPVFSASPAFGITITNISNWNTAFSWGNHAGLYSLVGHNHAGVYEPSGEVATHSALATGIHGVGVGTIAKVGDIAVDGNLSVAAQDAISKRHTQGTDTALGTVGTKNPPIDADKAIYRDSAASDILVTSTWTQIKAFLKTYWDTLYEAIGAVATHAGLTTGVHGVSASGFEDKVNKAVASGYASLDASVKVVQDPANATATPTQNKIPIADGVGGTLALGWIPAHKTSHQDTGADEISVAGLSGLLADPQTPLLTSFQKARAYRANAQSITDNAWNTILIDTDSFDPSNITDLTNSKIIPTLAGYYQVSGMGCLVSPFVSILLVSIFKNGVEVSRGLETYSNTYGSPVTDLIYCNGSTDYLQLKIYQISGGAIDLQLGSYVNFLSVVGPF